MLSFLETLWFYGKMILEIICLAIPLYYLFIFLKRTRGYRILIGIVAVFLALELVSGLLDFAEIRVLLGNIATTLPIFFIVIFQQELRRVFAEIGSSSSRKRISDKSAMSIVSALHSSIVTMAKQRIGSIIAIEQSENLDMYALGARRLDAPVVAELINTIFYPGTSLHDGGVVIRGDKITYAGCVFPLGALDAGRSSFGTRHRAAIGLSEKSDAVVFVVSEETGLISVAYRGDLTRGLDSDSLLRILNTCIGVFDSNQNHSAKHIPSRIRSRFEDVARAIASAKERI